MELLATAAEPGTGVWHSCPHRYNTATNTGVRQKGIIHLGEISRGKKMPLASPVSASVHMVLYVWIFVA